MFGWNSRHTYVFVTRILHTGSVLTVQPPRDFSSVKALLDQQVLVWIPDARTSDGVHPLLFVLPDPSKARRNIQIAELQHLFNIFYGDTFLARVMGYEHGGTLNAVPELIFLPKQAAANAAANTTLQIRIAGSQTAVCDILLEPSSAETLFGPGKLTIIAMRPTNHFVWDKANLTRTVSPADAANVYLGAAKTRQNLQMIAKRNSEALPENAQVILSKYEWDDHDRQLSISKAFETAFRTSSTPDTPLDDQSASLSDSDDAFKLTFRTGRTDILGPEKLLNANLRIGGEQLIATLESAGGQQLLDPREPNPRTIQILTRLSIDTILHQFHARRHGARQPAIADLAETSEFYAAEFRPVTAKPLFSMFADVRLLIAMLGEPLMADPKAVKAFHAGFDWLHPEQIPEADEALHRLIDQMGKKYPPDDGFWEQLPPAIWAGSAILVDWTKQAVRQNAHILRQKVICDLVLTEIAYWTCSNDKTTRDRAEYLVAKLMAAALMHTSGHERSGLMTESLGVETFDMVLVDDRRESRSPALHIVDVSGHPVKEYEPFIVIAQRPVFMPDLRRQIARIVKDFAKSDRSFELMVLAEKGSRELKRAASIFGKSVGETGASLRSGRGEALEIKLNRFRKSFSKPADERKVTESTQISQRQRLLDDIYNTPRNEEGKGFPLDKLETAPFPTDLSGVLDPRHWLLEEHQKINRSEELKSPALTQPPRLLKPRLNTRVPEGVFHKAFVVNPNSTALALWRERYSDIVAVWDDDSSKHIWAFKGNRSQPELAKKLIKDQLAGGVSSDDISDFFEPSGADRAELELTAFLKTWDADALDAVLDKIRDPLKFDKDLLGFMTAMQHDAERIQSLKTEPNHWIWSIPENQYMKLALEFANESSFNPKTKTLAKDFEATSARACYMEWGRALKNSGDRVERLVAWQVLADDPTYIWTYETLKDLVAFSAFVDRTVFSPDFNWNGPTTRLKEAMFGVAGVTTSEQGKMVGYVLRTLFDQATESNVDVDALGRTFWTTLAALLLDWREGRVTPSEVQKKLKRL